MDIGNWELFRLPELSRLCTISPRYHILSYVIIHIIMYNYILYDYILLALDIFLYSIFFMYNELNEVE